MKKYILKRLLQMIPIMLGLSLLVFCLMYISPGDPATKKLNAMGIEASPEAIEKTKEEMGLNRPIIVQYMSWLGNMLKGDLGESYHNGMKVGELLKKASGYTFTLALSSLFIALLVSVPLGILTAVKKNRFIDYFIRFFSFFGNSMPNFLISVILMYLFSIKIKLFPVIADSSVKGLFLPAMALAIPLASRFVRQIRAQVLEELDKPYVQGAYARGVKNNIVLYNNVLHNCLSPIITLVGLSIGTLMGGSVVVETIFRWSGLGKLVMDSITYRDYPVIQAFVIYMALIYCVINLITDISYHKLDPRVKTYGGTK
ncbi:MAG: ABC transporter permease [Firmicutes bacterium]|nr:ABC transporter permease [Bacillota bacterium]